MADQLNSLYCLLIHALKIPPTIKYAENATENFRLFLYLLYVYEDIDKKINSNCGQKEGKAGVLTAANAYKAEFFT